MLAGRDQLLAKSLGDVDFSMYVWRFGASTRLILPLASPGARATIPASKAADVIGLYIDPLAKAGESLERQAI
jgi:hypothetical protein